jgi:hypothetical protein
VGGLVHVMLLKRGSLTIPIWANNSLCESCYQIPPGKESENGAAKIVIYHRDPPVKIMGNVADIEIAAFVQHGKPHRHNVV